MSIAANGETIKGKQAGYAAANVFFPSSCGSKMIDLRGE
jgi:hypothetical protein